MRKGQKGLRFLVISCLFSIVFSVMYSYAQEKITLTTYYPSPYGIYKEIRVDGIAVGSGYRYNPVSPLSDGVLLVNGSVGIGTTNPAASLQVRNGAIMPEVGNSTLAGIYFPSNPGGGAGDEAYIRYFSEGGENTQLLIGIGDNANDDITFFQDGADRLTITNGRIGVGTANPQALLQVRSGAIMPEVGNSETAGIQFPPDPGGGINDEAYIRYFSEGGENTKLRIGIDDNPEDDISFWQDGADRMTIVNRRVGIGTNNPTQALDVTGNIRATGDMRADISMTLGGVTKTAWPTNSFGPEYGREIHNRKWGNSVISMGSISDRACFLTQVRSEDVDSGGEWVNCHAYIWGGRWWLRASTGGDCDDCDVWCKARCILW